MNSDHAYQRTAAQHVGVPAIYGDDLSEPVRIAYGAWISALCDRTEHGMQCPFGCHAGAERCGEGRTLAKLEHDRWLDWRAVYREAGDA